MTVEFEDADESGNVSLLLNTYLAGRSAEAAEAAWTASDGDAIRSTSGPTRSRTHWTPRSTT